MDRLSASLALTIAAGPLAAQRPPAPPRSWSELTRAFDGYAAADSVVGGSLAVLDGGRIVARHDYGFQDRAARERADTNTLYHWGSITKTLTAVAIMQLRDRGKLSLDDRLTRYIPELRQLHDSFGAIDSITIAMLLSHSSGLQRPTWPWRQGKPWEPFEPTRWEQLVAMMPWQELHFRPGSRYGYSNPAFIYLARVIEQLTGDEWRSYVQKNIFAPLGMSRSYFGITPYHSVRWRSNSYVLVGDSATGRETVVENGREFDPGITIPNGGWNAPVGDLAAWLAFLTGARRADVVLRRSSLEEMWRARYPAEEPGAWGSSPADSMGLSFFILWRHGTRFAGHTGTQAGFRSFVYLNPANGKAVIAVVNTLNGARWEESGAGFRAVRDQALGLIAK